MEICIAEHISGSGAVAGGAGELGQASQSATGSGATGYGYPVIELTTGVAATLDVQLTKDIGGTAPSDLSGIASVILKLRSTMGGKNALEKTCTFTPDGKVAVTFNPAELQDKQGVYYAEFICYDEDGIARQDYRAYVAIRRGMDGATKGIHPLTIMDVRLALMDTDPSANQLLDDLEFSDMMILNCIMRALQEWNETPPTLLQQYDATSFPYREFLLKGVIGYLLQMVAYKYMRNQMRYNAGGFSTDTNDKGPVYVQLANAALGEWKNFVAAKKTEHNMRECFGTIEMPEFR